MGVKGSVALDLLARARMASEVGLNEMRGRKDRVLVVRLFGAAIMLTAILAALERLPS